MSSDSSEPIGLVGLTELSDEELLGRIQQGDSPAEEALFQRYYVRLVGFARNRMNPRLRQVEPASDVAQSALNSVMMGIPAGEVRLEKEHDLWPLLAAATLNKIRNRWRLMTRARRDIRRRAEVPQQHLFSENICPQSVMELNDLVDQLLQRFSDRRQAILRHLLNGYGVGETAQKVGVTEKTVYNTRQAAAASLRELLDRE